MLDEHSRLIYVEICADEKADTATGVLRRAVAWSAEHEVTVERVLSDNGSCYRSHTWRDTCAELGIKHNRTRPYRPQTNGKIERLHRTHRDGTACFEGRVNTTSLHRERDVLVEHLFRGPPFPHDAVLATGTGIVPGSGCTLPDQDLVRITVEETDMLTNRITSDRSALSWFGEITEQPHSRRRSQ